MSMTNGLCSARVNVGLLRNVTRYDLIPGAAYYWQVRVYNPGGYTYADAGMWWSFKTVSTAISKMTPSNGAIDQPLSVTLSWGSSAEVVRYEYCLDTLNDNLCNTGWVNNGLLLSIKRSVLTSGTTYYWQVRAYRVGGNTYANAGAWGSFKTGSIAVR